MDRIANFVKPISPSALVPEWNTMSISAVLIFALVSLICFILAFRCYPEDDDTPVGMKFLFSVVAAAWNVVYLAYYFVTVHIMGLGCG